MSAGIWLLIFLGLGIGDTVSVPNLAPDAEIEVFVRAGCSFCEEAKEFLQDLERRRPELRERASLVICHGL